mmetsp:Transcript_11176/g.27056  ORF Transcript_11176/g.27056 Transcript_11176/m.27056 type:complete len:294 (-) Transcript_11176:553-1434(-)
MRKSHSLNECQSRQFSCRFIGHSSAVSHSVAFAFYLIHAFTFVHAFTDLFFLWRLLLVGSRLLLGGTDILLCCLLLHGLACLPLFPAPLFCGCHGLLTQQHELLDPSLCGWLHGENFLVFLLGSVSLLHLSDLLQPCLPVMLQLLYRVFVERLFHLFLEVLRLDKQIILHLTLIVRHVLENPFVQVLQQPQLHVRALLLPLAISLVQHSCVVDQILDGGISHPFHEHPFQMRSGTGPVDSLELFVGRQEEEGVVLGSFIDEGVRPHEDVSQLWRDPWEEVIQHQILVLLNCVR